MVTAPPPPTPPSPPKLYVDHWGSFFLSVALPLPLSCDFETTGVRCSGRRGGRFVHEFLRPASDITLGAGVSTGMHSYFNDTAPYFHAILQCA